MTIAPCELDDNFILAESESHFKYAWIDSHESDVNTIIVGSSTLKYGLSCSQLEEQGMGNTISLAQDARTPITSWALLSSIELDNIKRIIIGLDPWVYQKYYFRHLDAFHTLELNPFETLKYAAFIDPKVFFRRLKGWLDCQLDTPTLQNTHKQPIIPHDHGSVALNRYPENFGA